MSIPHQHREGPVSNVPVSVIGGQAWIAPDGAQAHLDLQASVGSGHLLRQVVKRIGERIGIPQEAIDDMALAATEAFSNAIRHGAVSPDRGIEVCARESGGIFELTLQYPGDPFDVQAPELPDDTATTGRGRYLMAMLCDTVEYEFTEGMTRVQLQKRWA